MCCVRGESFAGLAGSSKGRLALGTRFGGFRLLFAVLFYCAAIGGKSGVGNAGGGAMSAVIWHKDTALWPPRDFESRLCAMLAHRVEAAYVFGSYGTREFGPESDIDLILVRHTELPFVERPRLFNDLYQLHPRLDLLVYLPGELEALLAEKKRILGVRKVDAAGTPRRQVRIMPRPRRCKQFSRITEFAMFLVWRIRWGFDNGGGNERVEG